MSINPNSKITRFLIYAYFNLDIDDKALEGDTKSIVRACVDRAYLDMCRTLRTSEKTNWEQTKNNIKSDLTDRLLDFGSIGKCKTDAIEFLMKEQGYRFTYGQAQKWVNMSLKYMWLLGLIEDSQVRELEAPIDSYIIHAVEYTPQDTAWSTLTDGKYEDIKKKIEGCATEYNTVIEWEFDAWIEQSKKEKK